MNINITTKFTSLVHTKNNIFKKWNKNVRQTSKQTQTHIPKNKTSTQQKYIILLSRSPSNPPHEKTNISKIEKSDTKFTEWWVKFTQWMWHKIDRPPFTRQYWQNPVTWRNSVNWKSTPGYNRNQYFSLITLVDKN